LRGALHRDEIRASASPDPARRLAGPHGDPDLKVACISAMGLVPLEGLVRLAQIDTLLGLLGGGPTPRGAHCPAAPGRLFEDAPDGAKPTASGSPGR
jgi:hypothetical protein